MVVRECNMAMPTIEQIEDFGRRIGEEFHPRQVVLFGSLPAVLRRRIPMSMFWS